MPSQQRPTYHRHEYQAPAYLIETIALTVELYESHTDVIATMTIKQNPVRTPHQEPLVLNGEDLELRQVVLDGRRLHPSDYEKNDKTLTIRGTQPQFTLEITTRLSPDSNTSLEGLYRSNNTYCTQCEAEGFRKITYYIDRPDNLAIFTTRIEGDRQRCPVMLSNGNLVEQGPLANGRHYVVWEDPFPKPCYLFALVAGQLEYLEDKFTTRSSREITLRIYVEQGNREKCHHAMRSLQKAMRWDEEVYGLEYDLNIFMIVAVSDFNMGAMENKGLNVFNAKYILASPETATDQDYLGIEGVVAHEYFHNWTGNRVTCRDWFQLSLKEGLTVFRDQEFSADMNSRAVQRIEDVNVLRTHQFREDSGPMAHPIRPDSYQEINNFYTATVYNKGAEVIRMMHTLLGAEGFQKGMALYFARHDGCAVTCDDFVAAMADANDYDLSQFATWYSQAGTPQLTVDCSYDAHEEKLALTIAQTTKATPEQPEKRPLHIPIRLGFVDSTGRDIPAGGDGEILLELTKEKEHFFFENISEKPVISFLRGFSAPVIVEPFHSRDELLFLMVHDNDAYNRWEAASTLAKEIILNKVDDLANSRPLFVEEEYVKAVAATIEAGKNDAALLARALQLPTETYLATGLETIDPVAIHQARDFVRRELGTQLYPIFRNLYDEANSEKEEEHLQLTPRAMGQRSLKNTALSYLMVAAGKEDEAASLCDKQFTSAKTMTEVIHALRCLSDSESPRRTTALAEFYTRWQHDPLVLDKWFTIQALSSRQETLSEVKELIADPAFALTNPNKVRALIGAFCSMNPFRFHCATGQGYRFLGEILTTLDTINPQIAARLVAPLSGWRKYDEKRQQLMRAELTQLLAKTDISKDVYEIVEKSL